MVEWSKLVMYNINAPESYYKLYIHDSGGMEAEFQLSLKRFALAASGVAMIFEPPRKQLVRAPGQGFTATTSSWRAPSTPRAPAVAGPEGPSLRHCLQLPASLPQSVVGWCRYLASGHQNNQHTYFLSWHHSDSNLTYFFHMLLHFNLGI